MTDLGWLIVVVMGLVSRACIEVSPQTYRLLRGQGQVTAIFELNARFPFPETLKYSSTKSI